jgi:molybdate transport system ATP-binding protein
VTGGALDARLVVDRAGFHLDAELALEPGETVAVMGPSGAGKSTLLAAVAGFAAMSEGHVRVDGVEVSGSRTVPPQRRGIVLLGQDARLFPHLSAEENIVFGLRAHGATRREAHASATRWLDRVGLGGYGARRPSALSGGQQQRVALARALATSPRVLLLDEPLTALDPETAGDIRALLAEQLRAEAATAIIVTHDALDAASLAARLLVLEDGAVTQCDEVRAVLATPATRFAATVAGTNRLIGVASGGVWTYRTDAGELVLHSDDAASRTAAAVDGTPLAAFVRPGSVVVRPDKTPGASMPALAAGEWRSRVVRLEPTPSGVRVHTSEPVLSAEVPTDAVAAWGLAPGVPVRLRFPPDAVRFAAAEGTDAPGREACRRR